MDGWPRETKNNETQNVSKRLALTLAADETHQYRGNTFMSKEGYEYNLCAALGASGQIGRHR
ncbi:hypothetical protein NEUTE1DRAFT_117497 [Neurospora tetrasperma FGSC 2508]|uniref:Uncharacterized protein n=1 Tax=Neurospora tetrasperma (strain FGSC 2508 / ATCC MYA-4615 / P0657) TaxID=510951 RepID=F8MR42_NEUT8|nr:uncharacterized protein NEUTE1DRAFT_117497 [Neurospora tetrasperma FGSC 2508]EGO56822.1 hypothetical protein NEUTE1DRAFT_117497 [Neurospora tetrasperma FGSC 2508]EGZ70288.1 hypothetical protein NEUTE2DRAFT_144983 [Neurospora tetrasperma FGSC 2509]